MWWRESVDEMWIGAMVALIVYFTMNAPADINLAAITVAGSAVSGLVVYLGVKPRKKNGGDNEETPIIDDTDSISD